MIEDKKFIKNIPSSCGIYFYLDKFARVIYIGKAVNLKSRIKSYWQKNIDAKTAKMLMAAADLKWQETHSNLEALILEANLIKKHQPYYNIKQKDDKSFVYFYFTNEDFPRVFLSRPNKIKNLKLNFKNLFGPYVSGQEARIAYKLLRKIFTFRDCPSNKFNLHQKNNQACLYHNIKLCSAPCVKKISKSNYNKTIKSLILFLNTESRKLINNLKVEMKQLAKNQKFEQAAMIRNQIFALNHIQDIALIKEAPAILNNYSLNRVEAYDVSTISGQYAVGSMVVFANNKPDKSEYRKFKIKTVNTTNDVGMIREILIRRFQHKGWVLPDLIIIDGGRAHYNIAKTVFKKYNLNIPVLAVAKGPKRNKLDLYYDRIMNIDSKLIEQIRDEAHRFAIQYHRKLRDKIH